MQRVRNTEEFIKKLKLKAKADNIENREKELHLKLSASDVWENAKVATELSQELAAVRERIVEISTLELNLSDVVEMYELALEELKAKEGKEDAESDDIIQVCYSFRQYMYALCQYHY